MSLSVNPAYLAARGVRAAGGPLDGQVLDDGGLLARSVRVDLDDNHSGFYTLKGGADGSLIYAWADLVVEYPPKT